MTDKERQHAKKGARQSNLTHAFCMYSVLLDGKAGPFDLVVLQNVVCKGHAQLLIERHGFFICDEIEGNVLFAAGQFVRRSHELGADSPAFVISIYAQIGGIKPITKIGKAKQNAHGFSLFVARRKADGGVLNQLFDSFPKSLFRILRTKIGSL